MAIEDDFFRANPNASWNDFLVSQPGVHRMLAQGWNPGDAMPVDDFRAWQNNAALNPDGTIQGTTGKVNPATGMVDYKLQDDTMFGGLFDIMKVLGPFALAAGGAGALSGALGGAGAGAGAAGEIAALTGSGGSGAGFGLSSGATGALTGGGAGVGSGGGFGGGGGMDYTDILEEIANLTGSGAGGGGVAPGSFDLSSLLPSLPDLPPTTNLQDIMTKLDSTPAGKSFLNQLTGGASDAAGTMSLLQRLQSSTGLGGNDLLRMAGQLGAAGLGAYGANQQANSLQGLADKYSEFGAPYRAMLAQSYADPSGFLANSPDIRAAVDQGTNATARALSVNGNPAGSGRALQEMQNYATQGLYGQLGNERNRLANFGGLSSFNSAAPTLGAQSIGQQGNVLNALGYGIQAATSPTPSLNDLWKSLNLGGLA